MGTAISHMPAFQTMINKLAQKYNRALVRSSPRSNEQSLDWNSMEFELISDFTKLGQHALCEIIAAKMAYMLSVWKLASRRRIRAVKHQKASASLRMT